jgi:predicted Zn-dependent protease
MMMQPSGIFKHSVWALILTLTLSLGLSSCSEDNPDDDSVNIFSITDDIQLGKQTVAEIEKNPQEYPILSETQYPVAYGHLRRISKTILDGSKVFYKDKFEWQTKIIKNDKVLNAFCTPGGYIYVYTGLIKFLDNETQLAGVMGHEIAHADRRHSTDQLTKIYGITTLLSVVLGNNPGLVAEMATAVIGLKFSRDNETEADKYSVIYLYPTEYDARGAKYFFEKIINQGGSSPPEFLSTHPNPDNRVVNIENEWKALGSITGQTFEQRYQDFKNSLP